jgi:hypothetical protein
MKTIEIKLYQFQELNKQAQEKALNNYRSEGIDCSYFYDEAHETVKKFHDIFGTEDGHHSWLDIKTAHIDENILELKGLRLRTYIINNFYSQIFSGKYKKSWYFKEGEAPKKLCKLIRTSEYKYKEGKETKTGVKQIYRSKINFTNDCELTGVCYDYSILKPLYDFLAWNDPKNDSTTTFEELMENCIYSLKKDLESEEEYINSDEAIIETFESNNWHFEENGKMNNKY